MFNRVEIRLEGVGGFSAVLAFKTDNLQVSLGSDSHGQKLALLSAYDPEVYIVGGEEFREKVIACRRDSDKWDETALGLLAFHTMLDHLREHPDAWEQMLKNVRESAYEKGVSTVQSEMRRALGFRVRRSQCREPLEQTENE